jgi:hypothetical protein
VGGADGRQGNIGLVQEASSSQEASSRTLHQGLVQEASSLPHVEWGTRSADGRRVEEEEGGGGGGVAGGAREAEILDHTSAGFSFHTARKMRENAMQRPAAQQDQSHKWWTVVSGVGGIEGEGGEREREGGDNGVCSERSVGDVVAGEGVLHGLYSQKSCV